MSASLKEEPKCIPMGTRGTGKDHTYYYNDSFFITTLKLTPPCLLH